MKKRIVIASTLKSVCDVRAYEKLAQCLLKTNKYEINIIGNHSEKELLDGSISYFAHPIRRKAWQKRISLPWKVLLLFFKIRPSVLIICTHELLIVALVAKAITGCKVVYDVQENYQLNFTKLNNSRVKKWYGQWVRKKEKIAARYLDQFWLAEACYQRELPFVKGKEVVLENKAIKALEKPLSHKEKTFLFSGTISDYSGVREAVKLYEEIHHIDPAYTLKIIGQAHSPSLHTWLEKKRDELDQIDLCLSYSQIPHAYILQDIQSCTFGIISYQPNEVNQNKIPTKLYEYSRYKLPFVYQDHTFWNDKVKVVGYGIPVDFQNLNASQILKHIESGDFNKPERYPMSETWEFESKKVLKSINSLLD